MRRTYYPDAKLQIVRRNLENSDWAERLRIRPTCSTSSTDEVLIPSCAERLYAVPASPQSRLVFGGSRRAEG